MVRIMSQEVEYIYDKGNLLEKRNTYFYTEFSGEKFISSWKISRNSTLNKLSELTNKVNEETPKPIDKILQKTYAELSSSTIQDKSFVTLDKLVQRFEVTKRIHDEYNDDWRPVDSSKYQGLNRYLKFAESLEKAYHLTTNLSYLNTLLKCIDTLTTLCDEMDMTQKQCMQKLICREREHVDRLILTINHYREVR